MTGADTLDKVQTIGEEPIPIAVWSAVVPLSIALHVALLVFGLPHMVIKAPPDEQPPPTAEIVIESGGLEFETAAPIDGTHLVEAVVDPADAVPVPAAEANPSPDVADPVLAPEVSSIQSVDAVVAPVESSPIVQPADTISVETVEAVPSVESGEAVQAVDVGAPATQFLGPATPVAASDVVPPVAATAPVIASEPVNPVGAPSVSTVQSVEVDAALDDAPAAPVPTAVQATPSEVPAATPPIEAILETPVAVEPIDSAVEVSVVTPGSVLADGPLGGDGVTPVGVGDVIESVVVAATVEASEPPAGNPESQPEQGAPLAIDPIPETTAVTEVLPTPEATQPIKDIGTATDVVAGDANPVVPVAEAITTTPSAPVQTILPVANSTSEANVAVVPGVVEEGTPEGSVQDVSEVDLQIAAVEPTGPVDVVAPFSAPTEILPEATAAVPAAPAVRPPEFPAIDPTDQVSAYVDSFDLGKCAHLTVQSAGADSAAITAFGSAIAPFVMFDQQFAADQGFEAKIEVRLVTAQQCQLLDALGLSLGVEAAGLVMLDKTVVRSGTAVTGVIDRDLPLDRIAAAEQNGVILNGAGPPEVYLVDDAGQIHDGRAYVLPASDAITAGGWRFSIPVTLLSSRSDETALVLAIWNRPKDRQPRRFGSLPASRIAKVLEEPGVFSLTAFKVAR